MSTSRANPTARRWQLAAELRQLRLDAGLSLEEVAAELMCSPAKVSRLETAGRGIQPRDVRDLCRLYKLNGRESERLMALATEAKQQSWWHGLRTLSPEVVSFIGLEAAAEQIRNLETARIPGLLQTASYTRALLESARAPEDALDAEFIEETIRARSKRQDDVRSRSTDLVFVLDEVALDKNFGTQQDMLDQLDLLIDAAERDNEHVHVVPHRRGLHPGVNGSFVLMAFPQGVPSEVVLVEGLLGVFTLEKPGDIARYRNVFNHVLADFALSEAESRTWLKARHSAWNSSGQGRSRRTDNWQHSGDK